MSSSDTFQNPKSLMILPFMGKFYDTFAEPLAWVGFRALIGLALVYESIAKIEAPFAQAGFVESIGFYPGWFWSPLLAYLQFVGGVAIAIGLLTRPFALANAVMLAITLWFHVAHPYGDVFLTASGMDFLKSGAQNLFTPAALSLFRTAARRSSNRCRKRPSCCRCCGRAARRSSPPLAAARGQSTGC